MASRLSQAALRASRVGGALHSAGGRMPAAAVAAAPARAAAAVQWARGSDRPDTGPSRNPDIYPSGHYKPDSPVPDPLNPDPDLYPPDVGVPRRDPDILPPRQPSPDIYPPADTPDMPEPPLPGKGPFMSSASFGPQAAAAASAASAVPLDSPKFGGLRAGPATPHSSGGVLSRQQGAGGSHRLLLKTDGGNVWLEARGLHSGPLAGLAWGEREHPGRGLSGEEQEAANKSRAAMEGVQKRDDQAPPQSYVDERGRTPPEVTPRVPTEAPDKLPAGSPRESLPGYTHATEPVAHIGKVSDDLGDVPEATHIRSVKPKVGPKASTGTPLDVPGEVPKPGFPGGAEH